MTNRLPLSPSRIHRCGALLLYGMTDIGLIRKENEDNFLFDEALGLCAVCDGMGGHEAGEVASAQALLELRDFFRHTGAAPNSPHDSGSDSRADHLTQAIEGVFKAIAHTNSALYQQNLANLQPEGRGMGTTLVGWRQAAPDAPLIVFNVGDSRLYRMRAGLLTQLTKDQTLHQQALDMGQLEHLPPRNLLLQAIGPGDAVTPEVLLANVQAGDVYLLCSDGLHSYVPEHDIAAVLRRTNAGNLALCCAELITLANTCGGKDNTTVVLGYCDNEYA